MSACIYVGTPRGCDYGQVIFICSCMCVCVCLRTPRGIVATAPLRAGICYQLLYVSVSVCMYVRPGGFLATAPLRAGYFFSVRMIMTTPHICTCIHTQVTRTYRQPPDRPDVHRTKHAYTHTHTHQNHIHKQTNTHTGNLLIGLITTAPNMNAHTQTYIHTYHTQTHIQATS